MRNEIKKVVKKSDTVDRSREEYKSPMLKEFGSVGALTQAGSAQGNENAQGPNMMA